VSPSAYPRCFPRIAAGSTHLRSFWFSGLGGCRLWLRTLPPVRFVAGFPAEHSTHLSGSAGWGCVCPSARLGLHFACTIAFGTAGFTTYYTMHAPDWLRDAYSPRESLCTVALAFPVSYTRHWPLCCRLSGFCHVGSGGLVAT
jgi:hypothetical protein